MSNPAIPRAGSFLGLGNVLDFQNDPIAFLKNLTKQSDNIVNFKFGPQYDIYLVTSPDYIRDILVKQWDKTVKWERQAKISRSVAPYNLAILEGDMWKKHRKLLAPAFHTQRIHDYVSLMQKHTLKMLETWQDNGVLDMLDMMTNVTMGIIGEILFDIPDIENDAAELSEALKVLLEQFMIEGAALIPAPNWIPTPRNLREKAAKETMLRYLDDHIVKRRAEGVDHGDVLSALLFAEDAETGERLTNEMVRDELYAFFVAGHETTAILLTWALYMLAKYPQYQQQLQVEVDSSVAGHSPTMDELHQLGLTNRIIQETLRMYPPAWSLFLRTVQEPFDLDDVTIPEGAILYISPYVVHYDPKWWDSPEQFNPSRFEGDWKADKPAYAFMPFGGGARVCIGSHMAEMEAAVILATIAKHYNIEMIAPNQEIELDPGFTLHPKGGMPLRLIHR